MISFKHAQYPKRDKMLICLNWSIAWLKNMYKQLNGVMKTEVCQQ